MNTEEQKAFSRALEELNRLVVWRDEIDAELPRQERKKVGIWLRRWKMVVTVASSVAVLLGLTAAGVGGWVWASAQWATIQVREQRDELVKKAGLLNRY